MLDTAIDAIIDDSRGACIRAVDVCEAYRLDYLRGRAFELITEGRHLSIASDLLTRWLRTPSENQKFGGHKSLTPLEVVSAFRLGRERASAAMYILQSVSSGQPPSIQINAAIVAVRQAMRAEVMARSPSL